MRPHKTEYFFLGKKKKNKIHKLVVFFCHISQDLARSSTIVVSGHHGKLHIDGRRLIIDEGGGLKHNPVAAVVLPSMTIVRDTDEPKK